MKARRIIGWVVGLGACAVVIGGLGGMAFRVALGPPVQRAPRNAVYAPSGVIATSQPLASQAGLAVLRAGGNAVDAAVTAAAVLNVVEPYMSGIGGDMFAILWSENEKRLVGINGSGRAGSLMTPEAVDGEIPEQGAQSVTVPGALAGWADLLEAHGTISLSEALQPAIRLAEEGFPVSKTTASEWALFVGTLRKDPGASAAFLVDKERAPVAGEWHRNPDLASTLRFIASEGPGRLYGGPLGQSIVSHLRSAGGFLTEDDLSAHRSAWVEPLSVDYRGYRLWELPPNGQGIAALEMLRLLEPFDLASMGHNSAEYLHHLIEAKKLAYSDLDRFVADPDFLIYEPERLLSDVFINNRRRELDTQRASVYVPPDPSLLQTDTTYISAADKDGNMISLINSLAGPFGSGVVVPGTGFALQNRGVGFSTKEGRSNLVGPGKRPFHTIIPGFVTRVSPDGRDQPWLSYGVVGGPQQPQAHVQILLNMLLFDMDVQQAVDAPRFRHWRENSVTFESAVPEGSIDQLRSMGHGTEDPLMEVGSIVTVGENLGLIFGGCQAVMRSDRGYIAGSDSRRDGLAAAH